MSTIWPFWPPWPGQHLWLAPSLLLKGQDPLQVAGGNTFEHHPDVAVVREMFVYYVIHREVDAVVKSHSFRHSHIHSEKVVVPVDRHVRQPSYPLSAVTAVHDEGLVADVYLTLRSGPYVHFHHISFYLFLGPEYEVYR